MRPFLKWAGGKFHFIDEIINLFPSSAKTYIEPFVGAGAIALNVNIPNIIINDINPALMFVYEYLKTIPSFIDDCEKLFVPKNNTYEKYYLFRKTFNETSDNYLKACLFVYLNRHGFNGLCRFNSSGYYNVPFGKYKIPYFPKSQLESAKHKLQNITIYNRPFQDMFDFAGPDVIFYCDPPYISLPKKYSFTSYSKDVFTLEHHKTIVNLAISARDKGSIVMISNHDTQEIRELYKDASNILQFSVNRSIACNRNGRKKTAEIMAIYQ